MTTLDPESAESVELRTPSPRMVGGEPPPSGVWAAVRSYWFIVLLMVIIGVGAGVAAGLHRKPRYSATARLAVLKLDFGSPGALNAFATAAPTLADTYARTIDADGVVDPLATEFHVSPVTLRNDLSAAAVPASPVFAITANARPSSFAIKLVNAAAQSLINYTQSVNASNPSLVELYTQLQKAEDSLIKASTAKSNLLASIAHTQAILHRTSETNADRAALGKATAAVLRAQDRVTALRQAYSTDFTATSETQYIQPLQSALVATSDKKKKLALLGFAGLAAGLGVGVILALALHGRRRRRVLL